ncbi:dTDP-glucose 4,6-dehydratase [Variibacter gotjawalensis]|uniref:dTDP-glucose 4,6-dehydratase n=1 Tax=Variibacter gotjawalensis TaxID=1333996 RepID=A0A0S3PZY5_9BRAD|nr:NAD(P)-dependent oxidoreductase [Variibacter gotjawalensis]NIK47333.1 nucleoside-diphosphate-sugar epimerase [Variibacter gotjawalensis]RZS49231.1 nucleoside-diphosphate-sugar epimerase [Variibacter gotjawalensis]BAT61493.1 dTDP-glucose 4,6-dehydratase [Variibacter gotjawalensis]
MKTRPERALVTGAAGFVGTRLCERLTDQGWIVAKLLRRRPTSASVIDPATTWIDGEDALSERLAAFAPHVIFNLAGFSQVAEARTNPTATFEANVAFVWRLLAAAQTLPQKSVIVQASSVVVYDPLGHGPMSEDEAVRPHGVYAASKASAEIILRSFELPTAVARLGNIYGPGDRNTARLIPHLVAQFSAGQNAFLREGGAQRSYLHVEDAVEALCALAEHAGKAGIHCETFNVAGLRPYSNRQIAEIARDVSGRPDLKINVETETASAARPISIERISKQVGWAPRIELRDGLRSLFNEGVALCA